METEHNDDEHDGETALSRSLRPLLLLAPLTLGVIVPALVYGWFSSQAADEAFSFVESALVSDADGTTIDQSTFCQDVAADVRGLSFHELSENVDGARASLSNLGFGSAVVDFKGWLEEPQPTAEDATSDSSTTDQDLRDDIMVSVARSDTDSDWCIYDIVVQ